MREISVTANAAPPVWNVWTPYKGADKVDEAIARFESLGAPTYENIDKITFDVSLTNNTPAGSSPAQTFEYRIYVDEDVVEGISVENAIPLVNFEDSGFSFFSYDGYSTTSTFPSLASGATDTRKVRLYIAMPEIDSETGTSDATVPDGIYHYYITQKLSTANVSAGFTDENGDTQTDGSIETTYFMTVNVKNNKVIQAILQDTNGNKLKGFEIQYTSPEPTYRVKLEKTSVRGTVPTDTPFLFDVKIDLPTGTDASLLSVKIGDQAVNFLSDEDGDDLSTVVTNVEVKVGHYVEITGLPQAATVFVYEHDDGVFEVTSKVEGMANTGEKLDAGNKDRKWLTYGTIQYNDGVITYNNEKADISLTGVSLRYAPYMAMMGAGLAVVGLSKTRRKEEEI